MGCLDGKVAVVTGAGRGIGRAEALLLAAEGARVVVNDHGGSLQGDGADSGPARAVVDEIRSLGGEAVANTASVSDWPAAGAMIEQAVDTFGRLDILVNTAGIVREAMSFNATEADFDALVAVHLKGTYATCHHAGAHWRGVAKSSGTPADAAIVNTASPNGLNGGMPGHVSYAVMKAGTATMTIALARELAPYGVRVNAIAPVAFTRMTEQLWESDLFPPERRAELGPEGVAAVAVWLASPLAAHVNGQIVGVHGRVAQAWDTWRTVGQVESPHGAWTIDDLAAASATLFAAHDPGIPPPER